ncbi:MAG: hypothetical protein GY722_25560 [bacterium]|nr:hypothetical protein [bacterium]
MIIGDDFLILHMPKTGGVFIRLLLEKYYGDKVRLPTGIGFEHPNAKWEQHHSIDDVPFDRRYLPVFGLVRNPWDWYVSWFHFFNGYPHKPPHFMTVSEGKTVDFAGFMTNLYRYPADSDEYTYNSFAEKYYRIFGCSPDHPRNPTVEIGHYETVHDDVHRFLSTVGVSEVCLDEIAGFRRMNNSRHAHYSSYYTPGLVDLVYRNNQEIIDEFGYEFETRS